MQSETSINKDPIDISGDGGVMKIMIKEGQFDECPLKDQEVDISYIGTLEDGKEIAREDKPQYPFQMILGMF